MTALEMMPSWKKWSVHLYRFLLGYRGNRSGGGVPAGTVCNFRWRHFYFTEEGLHQTNPGAIAVMEPEEYPELIADPYEFLLQNLSPQV